MKAKRPSTGAEPVHQDYPLTVPLDAGSLRIREDDAGMLWFAGADVCEQLDYANPWAAIEKHVDPEDKRLTKRETSTGPKDVLEINESGMYALIFAAAKRKPAAKAFRRKVTSEILPSIRRTRSYTAPDAPSPLAAELAALRAQVEALAESVASRAPRLQRGTKAVLPLARHDVLPEGVTAISVEADIVNFVATPRPGRPRMPWVRVRQGEHEAAAEAAFRERFGHAFRLVCVAGTNRVDWRKASDWNQIAAESNYPGLWAVIATGPMRQ